MSSWDGLNRRRFPRANYPCLITIRHAAGDREVILTHTENVGIGGVCLILNKPLDMFAPVDLEIDLMDTGSHIKCKGKIVWSIRRKVDEKKKPLFFDMGIEFTSLTDIDQQRIDEIVKRLVKKGQETAYT